MIDQPKKSYSPARGLIVLAALGGLFYWISKDQEQSSTESQPIKAPSYYSATDESGAANCRHFAKTNVRNPATVKFDWARDTKLLPNGLTITTQKFTAQNSFGVPGRLAVECKFDSTGMIDGRVYEIID